eukprot:1102997-Pyramimonas_sp.AAC.1
MVNFTVTVASPTRERSALCGGETRFLPCVSGESCVRGERCCSFPPRDGPVRTCASYHQPLLRNALTRWAYTAKVRGYSPFPVRC